MVLGDHYVSFKCVSEVKSAFHVCIQLSYNDTSGQLDIPFQ